MDDAEDSLSAERAKWEKPHVFQMYPKMLFKGVMGEQGKASYDTMVVKGEAEHRDRSREGWNDEPQHALAHYHQVQEDIGTAAAERAYRDRQMSASAQREALAAETAHDGHLASIPMADKKGRRPDPGADTR